MSDTLECFGTEFTDVTGFKATDSNDNVLTYIRPQGNLPITANTASVDVSQYATASVAVPETNFIVTLSWDTTQQKWLPDCTMADLWGAYQAGKTIALKPPDDEISDILTADGFWTDDEVYVYFVHNYTTSAPGIYGTQWRAYVWTTNGVVLDETQTYIQPSGTKAINASGNTDVTNYATASVPTASYYTGEEHEFYTDSNVRKWRYRGMTDLDISEGDTEGWHGNGRQYGDYKVHNAVPSNTTITPTTSAQTVGGANYMMEGAVTINAMPSGSATAPASISGTSASVSTGTNTLTLSKTVSVTPSVTAGYVSSGTAGNSSVSLTANITTQAAQTIHPSSSDQTISSSRYLTGTQTIKGVTTTNLTAANIKSGVVVQIGDSTDSDCVTSVTGTYSGGGGSVQYDTKTVTASNYPVSLDFTSMKGQPKFFVVRLNAQVSSSGNTTYYYIVDIVSNGTTTHGNCFRVGGTRRVDNITSGYSWSYSGTTLTITSSAASRSASPGAFYSGSYELMYVY